MLNLRSNIRRIPVQRHKAGHCAEDNPDLPEGDYFARGDMVQPFEKAAFDELAPGEVSDLVESRFGYHIIKLEEKRPEEVQPFAQARSEYHWQADSDCRCRAGEGKSRRISCLMSRFTIIKKQPNWTDTKIYRLQFTTQDSLRATTNNIPEIGEKIDVPRCD